MKDIAVCVSNHDQNVTVYETMDVISSVGFKNVFMQWYENPNYEDKKAELEYAIKKGLNVIFVHLDYRHINAIWEEDDFGEEITQYYINCIDDLDKYGIKLLVMHLVGGDNPPKPNIIGLNRLIKICDYAKSKNIKIAFENTKSKGYQEYVIENIKSDNVGICYDSGHVHCHFNDEYDFEKFKDRVFCIHIHDNYGIYDDHLIPFDGNLDFNWALSGLKTTNYNEYMTLELCYRNDYLSMNLVDYYKKAYEVALRLKNMYEEEK